MFKIGLPEPYWMRVANDYRVHKCLGTAVVMAGARIADGAAAGARSKLANDSSSNSPMMHPCGSLMKPSIKRFTYKVGARSNVS